MALARSMRRFGAATALALGLVVVAAPGGVAADIPVNLEFDEPRSATVAYGEYWSFALTGNWVIAMSNGLPNGTTVSTTGAPSGYKPSVNFYYKQNAETEFGTGGTLAGDWESRPLGTGDYTFVVTFVQNSYHAQTPVPAKLTITPAKLGMELRMVADESSPENAIITVGFTGPFVESYIPSSYVGAPLSPAGSWKISVADAAGSTVLDRTIEREAGDDVLSTSMLWDGAKPGEEYTATASFVPSGPSAENFSVTAPSDFDFTASERVRPTPTSTAATEVDTDVPAEPDFSVPLWWLLLIGAALAALIGFTVAFAIRLGRAPRARQQQAGAEKEVTDAPA